ncbi:MAG: NYN domain-containing protein [Sphingomonadales bacterium]|nr:NYN domain-containing protein [Sphingomonadales bacterium]
MRAAVYFDGYNLYHAVNDLGEPFLKWVNLWKLAEEMAKGHSRIIEKVVFCTAYFPGDTGKRARHEKYVNALKINGVTVLLGHTTKEPMDCKNCQHKWDAPREKETDINLALAIFDDAYQDVFDDAYIVTADTDQAATMKVLKSRFPNKRIFSVTPPGRPVAVHLRDLADHKVTITKNHLEACVMPRVLSRDGFAAVVRPDEYAPPGWWVHPKDRPR